MTFELIADMGEARRRRELCAYCGAPKTSDDHIPPKNLFPTDRTNLITVPSCDKHNGGQSGLDERFRNYIAAKVGAGTPAGDLLLEKTIRSVVRSKGRQWRPDLSAFEVRIESDAFKPAIERITRGLYWDRYGGHCLPLNIEMQIGELRMGKWFPEFVSDMNRFRIAGNQFFCAYNRMDEYPTISSWVYVFHECVVAMALTDVRHPVSVVAEAEAKQT